jgi:hypothetical protein
MNVCLGYFARDHEDQLSKVFDQAQLFYVFFETENNA